MMKWILLIALVFPVCVQAQSRLDLAIQETIAELKCMPPDERDPVKLSAALVQDADSIAVVMKVKLAAGWHIYSYVPETLPYIPMEFVLQLPENYEAVGDWIKSKPMSSANDPGVLMYEHEAVFIRKAIIKKTGKSGDGIKAGLYYQTCNLRQCLPPVEKVVQLAP